MDKQFDELSKSLAEGISRREALRKFGVGLAGALSVALSLGRSASAQGGYTCCSYSCHCPRDGKGGIGRSSDYHVCVAGTVCPAVNCSSGCDGKLTSSQAMSDCTKCK